MQRPSDADCKSMGETLNNWQDVWNRLAAGHDCMVLGDAGFRPPDDSPLKAIVIDCAFFPGVRGSLEEMHRRVHGRSRPLLEVTKDKLNVAVRWHLMGAAPDSSLLAADLAVLKSLRSAEGSPSTVLVFRGVDLADAGSLRMLARLLRVPASTRAPLLLTLHSARVQGPAVALLESFERESGSDAIGRFGEDAKESRHELVGQAALPPPIRQALRACVAVGDRFESKVAAELLDLEEGDLLGRLQQAVDAGLPLEDRGEGRFCLPADVAQSLRKGTLPSLVQHWHARLALLFGGGPCDPAEQRKQSSQRTPADAVHGSESAEGPPVPPAPSPQPSQDAEEVFLPPVNTEHRSSDPRGPTWWQSLHEGEAVEPAASAQEPEEPQAVNPSLNAVRAAGHAEAAEHWSVACEQHLAAAAQAKEVYEFSASLEHAKRAVELTKALPFGEQRRLLEVQAQLYSGEARFSSLEGEHSLVSAVEDLEQALSLLRETDPPQLHFDVASVLATALYELGTDRALARALDTLQSASRFLLEQKRLPLEAARLLNDEAAVLVKLGDPVKANYLLTQSREVFRRVATSHPAAAMELAETDHLLAKLLFESTARPGREKDAALMAVEYARSAEEAYRSLGNPRQLARVRDTLGRLLLRLGRFEASEAVFSEALSFQRQIEDSIGQARTSAGLAEALFAQGQAVAALELLTESARLNLSKGAVRGMRLNLKTLMAQQAHLPPNLANPANELAQRLEVGIAKHSERGGRQGVPSPD